MGYLILIELLCSYKHPLSLWVNNLIHFYGCCKKIVDARKVSDEMPKRFVVFWNSVWLLVLRVFHWVMRFSIFLGCGVVGLSLIRLSWLCCCSLLVFFKLHPFIFLFYYWLILYMLLLLLAAEFNDLFLISDAYHNGRDTMYFS